LNREVEIKNIEKLEEREYFFNWKAVGEISLIKGGYHSIISEAYRAAVELKIGMDYTEDENLMRIWIDEKNSIEDFKKGTVAKAIGRIMEKRHYKRLCHQKGKGQQFDTFRNSTVSNFYIGNIKAPLSNGIMRFAIRARNDTLCTPAKNRLCLEV
jgi:hypothetical protein